MKDKELKITLNDDNTINFSDYINTRIAYETVCQEKDKEIERLNNIIYKVIGDLEDVRERLNYYGDDNFKIDMSMLTFWIDLLKEYKVGSDKDEYKI